MHSLNGFVKFLPTIKPRHLLYAPAIILVGVSALFNAQYGLISGGVALLLASISSDILKAACLPSILNALEQRDLIRAILLSVLLLITGTYSLVAAIGFISQTRSDFVSDREKQISDYSRWNTVYTQVNKQIERLGTQRTAGEVKADLEYAITLVKAANRWGENTSKSCTNATVPQSIQVCQPVNQFRAELELAKQAAILWGRKEEARVALSNMQNPKVADNQAQLIQHLTGQETTDITIFLNMIMVALVEGGSILGFLVVGRRHNGVGMEEIKKAKAAVTTPNFEPPEQPFAKEEALDWITSQSGSFEASLSILGQTWGRSRSTVGRWLKAFENEKALRLDQRDGLTLICIK